MPKRVLHFFPHKLKPRHGGPYSVLFHLKKGLQSYQHKVVFLEDLVLFNESPLPNKKTFTLKQAVKRFIPKIYLANHQIKKWLAELAQLDERIISTLNINQWDILHFHETIDLWRYRACFSGFKGKLLLTSHSPKPYHLELLEDVLMLKRADISPALYKTIENIDLHAYTKANHLIFPCREATESYKTLWPRFTDLTKEKEISSIPTGIHYNFTGEKRNTVRKEYNIPPDAFVVTYIGRKNCVKGYDLLVEAAQKLLLFTEQIYFIIIGKIEKEHSSGHTRWIETGWSDNPLRYIEASDLHVVPNRFTNFDLNVLEVLPLAKPLLLSNTGGNKYFKQFDTAGILYCEPNINDLVTKIKFAYGHRWEISKAAVAHKAIYQENFTADHFAKHTLEFYESLQ